MEVDSKKAKFMLALNQYNSIDKNKCEQFGSLIQGFLGFKDADMARIVPFTITSKQDLDTVLANLDTITTGNLVGVSFVQHYIHYT